MKIIATILFLLSSGNLFANENSNYGNLSNGELYRAVNWIRDVSNPNHTPTPSSWTQESRVGDTLFIDGEIQGIQWSLLKSGDYKGVKRVVLNSFGGLVSGAQEFADVIREQGLTTVIPAGGVCMSACTLIFQAGVKRQAHRSAVFMYHAPRSGRIGMSNLNKKCEQKGEDYCAQRIGEFESKAQETTDTFFAAYTQYGLDSALSELIYTLPEEKEEFWREDGNWFKKVDLVFADDPQDIRLSRLNTPHTLSTDKLSDFKVVTEWFDFNPGWTTDKSVAPENPYSMP